MHTVVERELELRLLLPPGRSVGVPALLSYRTDDPYAVHMAFHLDSPAPVYWTFARELLVEGVFRPCGEGDVRIWPRRAEGRTAATLRMALSSPSGDAVLEAPAGTVSVWLERTLRAVPFGREEACPGLDEELRCLLSAPGAGTTLLPHSDEGPGLVADGGPGAERDLATGFGPAPETGSGFGSGSGFGIDSGPGSGSGFGIGIGIDSAFGFGADSGFGFDSGCGCGEFGFGSGHVPRPGREPGRESGRGPGQAGADGR